MILADLAPPQVFAERSLRDRVRVSALPPDGQALALARHAKLRALHRQAREQRESIWRDRMLADALLAVRDPNAALN
jgi:hypothetical protein